MDISELLLDAFGRVRDATLGVLDGASREVLTYRPDPDANSIAWLVWHLTRIQDDHVAGVAGTEQEWLAEAGPSASACRSRRGRDGIWPVRRRGRPGRHRR